MDIDIYGEYDPPASPKPIICSHRWIDPNDPPIARGPYSPWIGPLRREMKKGTTYHCQNCEMVLKP
jgi:hypothetical protein